MRQATQAGVRRRRAVRLAVLIVVAAAVVGLALLSGAEEPSPGPGSPGPPPLPEAACEAHRPRRAQPLRFGAPNQALEDGVDYGAVIVTSCGDIEIDLAEAKAPHNVNSFVFLARRGFYDGLQWYRIVPNSTIEAGDPNNTPGAPPDGPGYTVADEYPPKGRAYVRGVVAMTNEGPFTDSAGSRFFIVTHEGILANTGMEPAGFEPHYSIIGMVARSSFDVLAAIGDKETSGSGEPADTNKPIIPIFIESIEITEARG